MSILDEAVKRTNFINSQPFNTHIFYILFDELGSVHKHSYNWTANWTRHFFYGTSFVLERMTDGETMVI